MLRSTSWNISSVVNSVEFNGILSDEQQKLDALMLLLQTEQDALVRGDADCVAGLAADKASRIESLARLGEQHNSYLGAQGLSGNAEGMQIWLSRNPELAPAAKKIWDQVLSKAQTAQQINQSNGILIENRLQQNQRKLAVLQNARASDGVYGCDGRLTTLRATRSLSQA